MELDEKYIKSRFGKEQPFSVPDGFFDDLACSIMNNVGIDAVEPEPCLKTIPLWHRYRKFVAAAACLLLVCGGAVAYLTSDGSHTERTASVVHVQSTDWSSYNYNEVAEYSMLDNEDIYALVASN